MFCKHCHVEVEGQSRTCPLCHKPFNDNEFFPIVKSTRKMKTTFTLVYLISALVFSVLCLLVNLLVVTGVLWSVAVVGVLVYIFVLISGTIFSTKHTASKIFLQTIALAVLTGFLQTLTPATKWAANYAVPIILLLGGIFLGITSLAIRRSGSYLLCMIFVAAIGLIPIVYSLIAKEIVLWPSIACAAVCGAILISGILWDIISGKKLILGELKRKFHI